MLNRAHGLKAVVDGSNEIDLGCRPRRQGKVQPLLPQPGNRLIQGADALPPDGRIKPVDEAHIFDGPPTAGSLKALISLLTRSKEGGLV